MSARNRIASQTSRASPQRRKRIVPMRANKGVYLTSESSIARVTRVHGQNAHGRRAKAQRKV